MSTNPQPAARILIAEDEALIAWELRDRLKRLGMTVVGVVDSAAAAIQAATHDRPDVVLMDIQLRGERNGIDAAQEMRQLGVPVVFLTAHSDRATLERAQQTEPFGYIVKPFQERDLVAAIESAIQRHSVERQLKREV